MQRLTELMAELWQETQGKDGIDPGSSFNVVDMH